MSGGRKPFDFDKLGQDFESFKANREEAQRKEQERLAQEKEQKRKDQEELKAQKAKTSIFTQLDKRSTGQQKKLHTQAAVTSFIAIDNDRTNLMDNHLKDIIWRSHPMHTDNDIPSWLFAEKAFPSAQIAEKVLQSNASEDKKEGKLEKQELHDSSNILIVELEGEADEVTEKLSDMTGRMPKIISIQSADGSKKLTAEEVEKEMRPEKPYV